MSSATEASRRVEQPARRPPLSLPPQVRYVLTAALLMAALYGVYYFPYEPDNRIALLIDGYNNVLARAAGWAIGVFDDGVNVDGAVINGQFPLRIVKSCSALDAQALFVGAVVAFPTPLRKKALGLLFGLLALTSLNLIRLALLYFVGAHAPASFDTLHEEVFPLALVMLACACFVVWTMWVRREQSAES